MKPINVEVVKYSEEELHSSDEEFTHIGAVHIIEKLRENGSTSDIIFTPNREQESYVLLYATYSTCDSRSAADGILEYIAVYSDVWKAMQTKEKLERMQRYDRTYPIDLEDGQGGFAKFIYRPPWSGWWDRLEKMNILILKLERIH